MWNQIPNTEIDFLVLDKWLCEYVLRPLHHVSATLCDHNELSVFYYLF